MTTYQLKQNCTYCNGTGKVKKNVGTGTNPSWVEFDCVICSASGRVIWGEHEQAFSDVIDTILDKCTDTLDKCNDILEKLNE